MLYITKGLPDLAAHEYFRPWLGKNIAHAQVLVGRMDFGFQLPGLYVIFCHPYSSGSVIRVIFVFDLELPNVVIC